MVSTRNKCVICTKTLKVDKGDKSKNRKNCDHLNQFCKKCLDEIFPFSQLSENEFQLLNKYGINNITGEESQINLLSPTENAHLKAINALIQNLRNLMKMLVQI